jgi:hypothetical protein
MGIKVIAQVIEGRRRDLGGFEVNRVLPAGRVRQMVGPFIFFDHLGPANFGAGQGIDVRPHPHIGLSTVTYLFAGEIVHRDSLGYVQAIRPGDVNWMTAGRGIVHSERSGAEQRARAEVLHGIQSWVALPRNHEETEPAFDHHPANSLPVVEMGGVRMTIIAGQAFGVCSPVETFSETLYVDVRLSADAVVDVDADHEERAVYVVRGFVEMAGERYQAGQMIVLRPDSAVSVQASDDAHIMLVGGARMEASRQIWWNFVASSKARIEQAKRDWREGHFDPVPGETEFIPLPD